MRVIEVRFETKEAEFQVPHGGPGVPLFVVIETEGLCGVAFQAGWHYDAENIYLFGSAAGYHAIAKVIY